MFLLGCCDSRCLVTEPDGRQKDSRRPLDHPGERGHHGEEGRGSPTVDLRGTTQHHTFNVQDNLGAIASRTTTTPALRPPPSTTEWMQTVV